MSLKSYLQHAIQTLCPEARLVRGDPIKERQIVDTLYVTKRESIRAFILQEIESKGVPSQRLHVMRMWESIEKNPDVYKERLLMEIRDNV
jgi:hypothetical protein